MRWYYWVLTLITAGIIYKVWFAKANFRADRSIDIKNPELREVSGLVASAQNSGYLWVHNDGSRHLRLFLVDKNGVTKRRFKWTIDTKDFEDIAIGAGSTPYLYVGDIGDNNSTRKLIRILRLREPRMTDSVGNISADTVFLKYPDGSRDAEAMFIDPLSNLLYIISKREDTPHVYKSEISIQDTLEMKLVRKLPLPGTGILKWVTAADISPDGLQILIRSYGNVYYWKRKPGELVEEAMQREPKIMSHTSEIQGEAIGFSRDGKGFYTLSEGKTPALNYNYINK